MTTVAIVQNNTSTTDTSSEDTHFPPKLLKLLPAGFAEDAGAMQDSELEKVVFDSEANIYSIEKDKASDVKLTGAKEVVKDLSLPYREAKTCQSAKIKYALWLLEGRGVSLDSQNS